MKRNYECLYIIGSQMTEEQRSALIAKFQKMAGPDATVDKWGIRKFTTPINYRKEGFYVLMNFTAEADLVGKMTALMNITEGIVRYMFVTKDEKQIQYDANKKSQRAAGYENFGNPKYAESAKTDAPKPAKKADAEVSTEKQVKKTAKTEKA